MHTWFPTSVCGNNLNTHTHTRILPISVGLVPFHLFTSELATHWATATVWWLVSGEWNSLSEREREQAREGGERAREMGGWHLNVEEKLWEVIRCCVLNVERCWRKYVMKKWKENLAILLMYRLSTSEWTWSRYCWFSQVLFCLCCGLVWSFGLLFAPIKMDYLTDPAVIMPILVAAVHFLTAAGFWYYLRRTPTESGKP